MLSRIKEWGSGHRSLGFEMDAYDLWCKLSGGLVHDIAHWLHLWSRGKDVNKKGMATFVLKGDDLWIMGGVLSVLLKEGILNLGKVSAWPEVGPELVGLRDGLLRLLRPYQADSVCSALDSDLGRGLIEVATGGGKTYISAGLAAVGSATGMYRWLYLAPNGELAAQTDRTMRKTLPHFANALGAPRAEVKCTTYTRADRFGTEWDGIIADECHRISCRTFCMPFSKLRARWRIGLSGTPLDRQDAGNALVIGLLGPVLYKIGLDVLEREGHLTRGLVQPVYFDHSTGTVKI